MTLPPSLRALRGLSLKNVAQLSPVQIEDIICYARYLKGRAQKAETSRKARAAQTRPSAARPRDAYLAGATIALLFENPSTRTRLAIHTAVAEGGGAVVDIGGSATHLGGKESFADSARTISQFCSAVAYRGVAHARFEELCSYATIPVINALTARYHPTQALADLLTIHEHYGRVRDISVAYLGDCNNNIARSLALAAAQSGMCLTLAAPAGYEIDATTLDLCEAIAEDHTRLPEQIDDPRRAAQHADVIYTDVWYSMGSEQEKEARIAALAPYRVTTELMARASSEAIFMHCLPANRGQEATDEVIDSARSLVWPQAGNRRYIFSVLLRAIVG